MADSIYTFDPTASNNTSLDGIPYGPNQLYHNKIDDWFRAVAAKLAQLVDDIGGVNTVGGTANAITVTLASGIAAYATGQIFSFKAASSNTAAVTINVNSIGAKAIRKIVGGTDVALAANDILAGVRYGLVYDSTANSAAGAFIIVSNTSFDAAYPPGHLYGLTLSNNVSDATNDIDIAVGSARDESNTANIVLSSALTKRLDAAWAVGTNQGMLASGAALANGTYHIFLIKRPDTGVVDVAADTSVTGANIAANTNAAYTLTRRIGSIIRISGAIYAFRQTADEFMWATPANDFVALVDPGTSAALRAITVPTGLALEAVIRTTASNSDTATATFAIFSDPATTDVAPSVTQADISQVASTANCVGRASANLRVRTNTSNQIRSRFSFSSANVTLSINTLGYVDRRGR